MTCTDCVKNDVCINAFSEKVKAPNVCGHFRSKENYTDIVYCKECQYRNTLNCNARHERADMDYCSHGRRRKTRHISKEAEKVKRLTRLLIEADYYDSHIKVARYLIRNGVEVKDGE